MSHLAVMAGPVLRPHIILCLPPACAAYAGILNLVLAAQKLDAHDVEGVEVLLDSLYRKHCLADTVTSNPQSPPVNRTHNEYAAAIRGSAESSLEKHDEALDRLLQMDRAAAHGILRDYLTAATAKDLSIMITLRGCNHLAPSAEHMSQTCTAMLKEQVRPSSDSVRLQSRIALVDLDLKPLRKIYEHWKLDRDILDIAATMRERHAVRRAD